MLLIGITVISAAHVSAQPAWAQSGLVAGYSFNEGSGNTVQDASNRDNDGTIAGATWTASGRYGGALTFDGTSAVVNIPNSPSLTLTTAMTLEAWVRPTQVDGEWRDVVYKGNDNYFLEATSNRGGRPATGGTFTRSNVYGPAALPVNAWTHLAATFDGSTLKLYVNGAVVSSGSRGGTLATSGSPLQIGGDSVFGQYFAGTIDEVRVYNIALTDAQVRSDMNSPIGSAPPAPAPSAAADLTLTKTHTGSFTQGQAGATYVLTIRNGGSGATSGVVSVRDTLPAGLTAAGMSGSGWSCTVSTLTCTRSDTLAASASFPSITVTVNVSSSAPSSVTNTASVSGGGESNTGNDTATDVTAIASVVSPLPQPATGLVAAFSFNEGSGSTVQDSSDRNNDGTIGTAAWTASGRYGGALAFNGTSAVVNVPDTASLHLAGAMTLEAWVRPTLVNAQWRDVIYKGNDMYYLEATSDRTVPVQGGTYGSTVSANVYGPANLAVNTWTHLAGTYDGATVKLYVNGTVVASGSRSGTIGSSNNPLQIGGDSIFGQYFAGTIDEVRVYSVALTAAQIQSDMTTPIGGSTAPLPTDPTPPPPTSTADTVPPTVAMTSPAAGAHVSGTLSITANASDNVGVTSVTFLVDGTAAGTDTSAPYSVAWNTATLAAGSHSLQAQARDAAGNVGTSSTIVVTVDSSSAATATFTASPDDAAVSRYVLEIFATGVDVNTAAPAQSADLGKPPVVNGQYSADISATLRALTSGTYVATVSAVASAGTARSAPSPPFTIAGSSTASVREPDAVSAWASPASPGASHADSHAASARASVADGTLWVTNSSTHMVAAFDATTGDVLATIPVGARPVALSAPAGSGRIFVADEDSDTVSVVDKATMTRIAAIALPMPFGRKPHFVSASADGGMVYVAENGSNVVDVIDTAAIRVTARFAAGQPGSTIRAAIPDASGQIVYALTRGEAAAMNGLVAIEAATGRWLWMMPLGGQPADLALEPDGRTALVSIPSKNAILVIDLEQRVTIEAVDLGPGNTPDSIRWSLDRHAVITLQGSQQRIAVIDPASHVRIVPLADVAATRTERADAQRLTYMTLDGGEGVEPGVLAVDPSSGGVVRRFRLPGGGTASDAAFDAK
jgi:YVTN family beta-propeller protein